MRSNRILPTQAKRDSFLGWWEFLTARKQSATIVADFQRRWGKNHLVAAFNGWRGRAARVRQAAAVLAGVAQQVDGTLLLEAVTAWAEHVAGVRQLGALLATAAEASLLRRIVDRWSLLTRVHRLAVGKLESVARQVCLLLLSKLQM